MNSVVRIKVQTEVVEVRLKLEHADFVVAVQFLRTTLANLLCFLSTNDRNLQVLSHQFGVGVVKNFVIIVTEPVFRLIRA